MENSQKIHNVNVSTAKYLNKFLDLHIGVNNYKKFIK